MLTIIKKKAGHIRQLLEKTIIQLKLKYYAIFDEEKVMRHQDSTNSSL